jgi:hypothetical protein
VWTPIGVADDRDIVEAMADLLREEEAGAEVRVVSAHELLHKLPSQDREHILDVLNSRTTSDIQRELTLRRAAEALLAKYERRSGLDRRSGRDRRSGVDWKPQRGESRSGGDRRSGRDRRGAKTAS